MDHSEFANQGDIVLLTFFVGIGFVVIVSLLTYVINALFLMRLLKRTGHHQPWAAWVPVMNTAALLEVGGFSRPWPLIGIMFAGSVLSAIPFVGWVAAIALLVLGIMMVIWIAKGVHAGLGMDSTGGIVLAVLVPFAWVIWMSIAAGKRQFNPHAAAAMGRTFPIEWFGQNPAYPGSVFETQAGQPAGAPPQQSGHPHPTGPPPHQPYR